LGTLASANSFCSTLRPRKILSAKIHFSVAKKQIFLKFCEIRILRIARLPISQNSQIAKREKIIFAFLEIFQFKKFDASFAPIRHTYKKFSLLIARHRYAPYFIAMHGKRFQRL